MNPPSFVGPAAFRALMAGFPAGVAVVGAFDAEQQPRGMTCSSLCSVALEPPTLLICLRQGSQTTAAVTSSGKLTVNFLHRHAQDTAQIFATSGLDRFAAVRWFTGEQGCGPHLTDDCRAIADCRVTGTRTVGDHVAVFAEVLAITDFADDSPLIYGLRRFGSWPGSDALPVTVPDHSRPH